MGIWGEGRMPVSVIAGQRHEKAENAGASWAEAPGVLVQR
jgi:hypothetical protein